MSLNQQQRVETLGNLFSLFRQSGLSEGDLNGVIQDVAANQATVITKQIRERVLIVVIKEFLDNGMGPGEVYEALMHESKSQHPAHQPEWDTFERDMIARQAQGLQPVTPALLSFLGVPNPQIQTWGGQMALHDFLSLSEATFNRYGGDQVPWRQAVGNPWLARNIGFMRSSGNIDDVNLEAMPRKNDKGGVAGSGMSLEEIMRKLREQKGL